MNIVFATNFYGNERRKRVCKYIHKLHRYGNEDVFFSSIESH